MGSSNAVSNMTVKTIKICQINEAGQKKIDHNEYVIIIVSHYGCTDRIHFCLHSCEHLFIQVHIW